MQLPELNFTFTPAPVTKMPILAASVPKVSDEEECQRIMQVLKETNGVVAGPRGAAQRLGLKRTTLLSRMKKLGINPH